MKRNSPNLIEIGHGETIAYNTSLDRLREAVRFSDAVMATTLPRGGLQVTQPRQTDLSRMRLYSRQMHAFDAAAWHAMNIGEPCRISSLADTKLAEVAAAFQDGFLRAHGLEFYAAVPLDGPLLEGYPGVLQLFRTRDVGDFTDAELRQLAEVGHDFDKVHDQRRRENRFKKDTHPLSHHVKHQQFALLPGRHLVFPQKAGESLDDVLRHNLTEMVESRFGAMGDSEESLKDLPAGNDGNGMLKPAAAGSNADRLLVPDRLGDRWSFRLALFPRYPAITGSVEGDEPVAFASHQPDCESWSSLRPSDFAADDEIGRLIPALHFMQENFAGDVSLQQVAKTVHLSPFHFHRRFTDLLGITPKHYLFDCQVAESKRRLAAQDMDLKEIASTCGFAHQSHFTSRFKQATGLTPTQWRRLAVEATG